MRETKNEFGVPHRTLDVSRARAQLTRLLRRIREAPRVYLIMQSGKPAGALVNLHWLEALLDRAQGKPPFTLFGQATAAEDWEKILAQLRESLTTGAAERYAARER